ncbi:MAG: prepilin-type N-terminal cleavage/methylation domain-containing protein, partial [Gammaproteobacteria bacterium]|nr:prepilin-type N-terminal cleavage/methylation domain-containing protein [Gammaproteobacteria bacterium]
MSAGSMSTGSMSTDSRNANSMSTLPTVHRSTGFSMVEAMIALVVLSIGLVSLAKFESKLINADGQSKSRSIALKLAQQKMETLRNNVSMSDYDSLVVMGTPDYIDDPEYTDGLINGTNTVYKRRYMLENGPVAFSKKIYVKVSWQDPRIGAQELVLNSVIGWDNPGSSTRLAGTPGGLHGPGAPVPPPPPPRPPPPPPPRPPPPPQPHPPHTPPPPTPHTPPPHNP